MIPLEAQMEMSFMVATDIMANNGGTLPEPLWTMTRGNERPGATIKGWANDKEKLEVVAAMKELFMENDVRQYTISYEADVTLHDMKNGTPDHTYDALVVIGVNKSGEMVVWQYELKRVGHACSFGEREVLTEISDGLLIGLLS